MRKPRRIKVILLAEDNDGDFLLIKEAFEEAGVVDELRRVEDGEQLMDYLHRRHPYEDPQVSPTPALILLDLNMPRMDGREVIPEIRMDGRIRYLPIVVLSTSNAEEDVLHSYRIGVNSFVRKPDGFEGLVHALRTLARYWLEIVELPSERTESLGRSRELAAVCGAPHRPESGRRRATGRDGP